VRAASSSQQQGKEDDEEDACRDDAKEGEGDAEEEEASAELTALRKETETLAALLACEQSALRQVVSAARAAGMELRTGLQNTLLVVRSGGRIIKPCGLRLVVICCVAILCPVASVTLLVALCSLSRLSSRLCCHRRYLNLAWQHGAVRACD
jgi:hypothetical protein